MEMLLNLPSQTFDCFNVSITDIKFGWMDITISNKSNSFSYLASYTTDPINDLLKATVNLVKLYDVKSQLNPFIYVKHELEKDDISWLLTPFADGVAIVILRGAWPVLEEQLEDVITGEDFFNSFEFQEQILFTMKGPANDFVKCIISIPDEIDKIVKHEEDFESDWGFNYSFEDIAFLKNWLKENDNTR